jgi:hypothetical protein
MSMLMGLNILFACMFPNAYSNPLQRSWRAILLFNLIYKSECVCVCPYVCSTVSKQLKNTTIKTGTVSYIVEAVA